MPLAATITDSMPVMSAYVSTVDSAQEQRFRRYFESDSIRTAINEVQVASVVYPLRRTCGAYFLPGIGEFVVEGFSPIFVGRGSTADIARQDWLLKVHAAFQELLCKRPFEMTADDRRAWSILSSRIDVTVYRNQTPIQVKQFGKITQARPYPQQIQWENGEREAVGVDEVDSPDFITYKPGQPIEAIVARDPLNFRLLRIVHIERRSTPSRLSAVDEAKVLESIGSSQTLPTAGWE